MTSNELRILGLMAVYNEDDILEQTILHSLSQGIELIILDNGSTDQSFDIASAYQRKGVLCVRHLYTETYRWAFLLSTLCEWAHEFHADWGMLIDADTFLESSEVGVSLRQGIENEARGGYNVIKFNQFEFWPTSLDPLNEIDIRKRIKYYTFNDDRHESCWLHVPGVDISKEGGHTVFFPSGIEKRVSPTRFVMRHYKIRSYEQGLKKVYKDRLPRFRGEPTGWHIQYNWMTPDIKNFVRDPEILTEYQENGQWNMFPKLGRDGQIDSKSEQ